MTCVHVEEPEPVSKPVIASLVWLYLFILWIHFCDSLQPPESLTL
jgi:hypothetical protein